MESVFYVDQRFLDEYEWQDIYPVEFGKWYFWDELGTVTGPYDSKECAEYGMANYFLRINEHDD